MGNGESSASVHDLRPDEGSGSGEHSTKGLRSFVVGSAGGVQMSYVGEERRSPSLNWIQIAAVILASVLSAAGTSVSNYLFVQQRNENRLTTLEVQVSSLEKADVRIATELNAQTSLMIASNTRIEERLRGIEGSVTTLIAQRALTLDELRRSSK